VIVTGAALCLIAATGGATSHFFLWLIAIVAVYPLILKPKLGLAITVAVAAGYALMMFIPVDKPMAGIEVLSGVYNRRHFFERAWLEYTQCERPGGALTVVLFDLNDFKRINDTCGHALGDECLRRFAKVLSTRARKGDVVARLGADTGTKGAAELIRRVRSKLRRDSIESPFGDLNLKTCAGVATMTKTTRGLEDLLDNADRDLYRAKDRLDTKQVRDRRRHLQVA